MEHMVLEAEELGLSTCWVGWFNERKMKKILNIPSTWSVTAVLTVGYADPEYSPKPQKRHSIEKILILK
jgi:nitroreductase